MSCLRDLPCPSVVVLLLLLGVTTMPAGETVGAGIKTVDSRDDLTQLWWNIDRAVIEELIHGSLADVLSDLDDDPGTAKPVELLHRFDLWVRAGRRAQALATIERLAQTEIPFPAFVLSQIGDFLIEREEWGLTRRFLERFPQAEPGWGYVFIKHWAKSGEASTIDAWLAARADANPDYWFAERLRFRNARGTADSLIAELVTRVKARPESLDAATRYLGAVDLLAGPVDVTWMADICKPATAYESYQLGWDVARRSAPTAIVLYQRSLDLPYTERDREMIDREMRLRSSRLIVGEPDWEGQLRLWTKHALAEAYQASGQPQKAQPLVEELSAVGPHALPPPGWGRFAGQVQEGSGARVIENRIRQAENQNRDSAEYWVTRAEYYAGRGEHAEAISAYEQALTLSPMQKPHARALVTRGYENYLRRASGSEAAVRLLRREMLSAPPGGEYARQLFNQLLWLETDNTGFIRPTDEILWAYLAARESWDHIERRLLGRMRHNAKTDELEPLWNRAEALAAKTDPSRAAVLGEIMAQTGESARSIARLQDALARLPDEESRERTRSVLFQAHLDLEDWHAAEEIWPQARLRLTPRETPQWLGRIALAAARSGAHEDALRLWREKSDLDRGDLRGLEELTRNGLGPLLRAFYRELKEADPECWVPETALQKLG